ncbi:MAG TPA: histidinol dehydrogenase [Thermoanaerobaculia bacterium]|nr:histidinol dehydrogenase [Thermoanaerobaculia bacterium]
MSVLTVIEAGSRAGRRAVEKLVRRGEGILDERTMRKASAIVTRVRRKGDRALLDFARKLDGAGASSVSELRLNIPAGSGALPGGFAEALERAIAAVERFHAPQVRTGYCLQSGLDDEDGVMLEERIQPLRRVGVYVPGGRAAYPSTVVMTVIPARLAGVREIAVATPPGSYRSNAALRHTLERLGVTEVWGMGGAHAVAAFAYGTETVGRVDKIVGPGSAWVTAAKKVVSGDVGIDGIAGPSEVVIVADADADPALLAADLLAQAEHDPLAAAVLIVTDRKLGKLVAREVGEQLRPLSTSSTARASLTRFGAVLVVRSLDEAVHLVEKIAPEHLQLVGQQSETLAGRISSAGAIFLGASTPEVFGDYIAGPSHVLPTCGSARFASSLGVEDFLRRSHVIRFTQAAAARRAAAAAALADAEGLPAHAASARRRLG